MGLSALWAWAAATGGRWAASWPAVRGRLVLSGRPQRREARPVLWEVPGSGLGPPRGVALLKQQLEYSTKGDGPFSQKPTTQTSKRAKRTGDWASEAKAYFKYSLIARDSAVGLGRKHTVPP